MQGDIDVINAEPQVRDSSQFFTDMNNCGRNGYSVALVPDSAQTANSTECCYRVEISRQDGACNTGGIRLSMLPDSNGTINKFSQKYGAAAPWLLTGGTMLKPEWLRNPLMPWPPTKTVGGVCVTAKVTPRFLVIEYLDADTQYMVRKAVFLCRELLLLCRPTTHLRHHPLCWEYYVLR